MNKQSEYQTKYDAENMKQYSVKYPIKIYKMVEKAMADTGMNRNRWTTTAIIEKLQRDRYIQSKEDQQKNSSSVKDIGVLTKI